MSDDAPSPRDPAADDGKDAVLRANAAFYAAFNAKDTGAMDRLWARSHPVACVHPGWNVLHGRESVMDSWRRILENAEQPKIVSAAQDAIVLGGTAIVVGRELVSGSPIATTNTFVREDGAWRMVCHHASPVLG